MASIPTLKLNDGKEVPMLAYGFGTANFNGEDEAMVKATQLATQNGIYHLDCAEAYMNESGVGAGIKASGVERTKLYVTTKVVGTTDQNVTEALDISLKKLGLEYIDLYLVHVPFAAGSAEGLQKIWRQMETVKEAGKARSIGVSNFEVEDLEIILEIAKTKPAINQIEFHPYTQKRDVVNFCRQHNIAVASFSALGALKQLAYSKVDSPYTELAEKYGVSPSLIGLRWCIDQDVAVVTTSSDDKRLKECATKLWDFNLHKEDVERLNALQSPEPWKSFALEYMTDTYGNYKLGIA
ncbi:Aldo/keto reductase [Xylariaceae sp. FL0594]|nr:Aldo/keto reductase [Xylariaceae sp. FL0594]